MQTHLDTAWPGVAARGAGKHQPPVMPPEYPCILIVKNPWAWLVSKARWHAENHAQPAHEQARLLAEWRWCADQVRNWAAWNLHAVDMIAQSPHGAVIVRHDELLEPERGFYEHVGRALGIGPPTGHTGPVDGRPDGKPWPWDPTYYAEERYLEDLPPSTLEHLNRFMTGEWGSAVLRRFELPVPAGVSV